MRGLWAISSIFVLSQSLPAMAEPTPERVTDQSLDATLLGYHVVGPWRTHEGDDTAWANPELDDSTWPEVRIDQGGFIYADDLSQPTWRWFRYWVDIETDRPIGLASWLYGAVYIYLDGQLVYQKGVIDSDPSRIDHGKLDPYFRVKTLNISRGRHLIAVRYAATDEFKFARFADPFGVWISDTEATPKRMVQEFVRVSHFAGIAMGFAGALAILHLLLFLFRPKAKENLGLAVLTTSMLFLTHATTRWAFVTSSVKLRETPGPFHFGIIALSLASGTMGYVLFRRRLPRAYYALYFIGLVLALLAWRVPTEVVYIFSLVLLADMLRVIFTAVIRKIEGSWVLGIGIFLFGLLSAYQMLKDLIPLPELDREEPYWLFGAMAFMLSISLFIARRFTKTAENLEDRIVEVKGLSDKAVEQERKAADQEIERMRLQAENEKKEIELQEAKKLEAINRELEEANVSLKRAQAQLVQSEKMASLGMLVAGIAHEINTPIGAVYSMHDSLDRAIGKLRTSLEEVCPNELESHRGLKASLKVLEDASRVIESGSGRVSEIVKRLKSFARLDESELKKVDVHEGIEDTLLLLRNELKHDITLERDFGELPQVTCFPSQLNQVFLNLIVNAKQSITGKGTIRIRTFKDDGRIGIAITDSGSGIPEDKVSRIFDPGYTTKGVGVGTGLGLSICYRIIQDHHGTIDVESEVGKGTTFTVWIPLDLEERIEASKKA